MTYLSDKEFKINNGHKDVAVVRNIRKGMDKLSDDNFKRKSVTELQDTVTVLKNTLVGFNSRLDEAKKVSETHPVRAAKRKKE